MKAIRKTTAKQLFKKYNLDEDVVSLEEFHFGLNVELEHGKKLSKLTNVTNDNIDVTCKIVLAHLIEDPRYYYYLKQIEARREKYWSTRTKPSIFLE